MKTVAYREIDGRSPGYYGLFAFLGALVLIGAGAALYMEHYGHYVTHMDNQIVWGTPHVFAILLIVAASGALNVASIGSVFGKAMYKPLAPLSGLLAIALLAGGLIVLVLDLGQPDRLIVAMTYYNFKSIFAWNIFLYTGFFVIVAVYLWFMMERRMNPYTKAVGLFAFVWRLILTTGTGSIFGFLVAREAYDSAVLAPMFIAMSFSFGLAIFMLVLMAAYKGIARPLGDILVRRLKNLLGIFIAAVFYFVLAYHLTQLYITEHHDIERFLLLDGGPYPRVFWIGYMLLGTVLPLAILYHPRLGACRSWINGACALVIVGGLALVYVIVIGGQAYPLEIFPGYDVSSSFRDGMVSAYSPSLPEVLLGVGGFALALLMVHVAIKVLRFLPDSLSDKDMLAIEVDALPKPAEAQA